MLTKAVWSHESRRRCPTTTPSDANSDEDERQRGEQHERLADGHVDDGSERGSSPPPISSARTTPPSDSAEVDLPGAHRRGEHVVEVAVEARLEDRGRVVGVRGLDHRHRHQPGHDEDLVGDAVDLADARPPSDRPKTRMNRNDDRTGATTVCVHSLSTRCVSRADSHSSPRWRWTSAVMVSGGHRLDVDVGQRVGAVRLAQAGRAVAGEQAAAADQRDLLAQLLGLLEVVRREQDRRALACRRRM